MEEAFGGFSIREYALNMRSVDFMKCWPFSSDSDKISKQDTAAMLPPMAVKKFRYWRDELAAMKKSQLTNKDMLENSNGLDSDELKNDADELKAGLDDLHDKCDNIELVCPVCKIFTAATVNAVNAHIDSCLAQTSRKSKKSKHRPHKKRSIVDIFAETPQIDKVEVEGGKGIASSNVYKGMKMSRRKKNKKKRPKVGTTTTKKKSKELKPCSLHKTSKEECGFSCHRLDACPLRRKKPKTRPKNIKKCTQPFNLIAKEQNSKLSACDILKNSRNVTEQSSSTICNWPGSSNNCPPSSQQLKRHVRFSDVLGAQADKEQCADGLTELNAVQCIPDDDALSIMGKEDDVQQAGEKGLLYGTPDPGKVKYLLGELVAPSQVAVNDDRYTVSHEGIRISSECDLYVGNPKFYYTLSEENRSIVSTQEGSSVARYPSSSKLTDHSDDQALSLAKASSLAGGRPYSQPAMSPVPLNENQKGGLSHLSQLHSENISGHPIGHQSHFNAPSIQSIGNFSDHPEWMQRKLTLEEGYNRGNYCGLPLNSQGELIQLGPGCYYGNNHALISSGTVSGPLASLPFCRCYLPSETGNYANDRTNCSRMMQQDQLSLFPMHNYLKEISEAEFSSRSNIVNSGRLDFICSDSERRSQMGCVPVSDLSSLNMCYKGCRTQYDQTPNQRGMGMIQLQNHDRNTLNNPQPTMRLMGKDVAIGQNSKNMTYLEEGKCSADEAFVMGYQPSFSPQNDSFDKSNFMQGCSSHARAGKMREPVPDLYWMQNGQYSEGYSMVRYQEPSYPIINWESSSGLQQGSLTVNRYPSTDQYFFSNPPSTLAIFNQAKNSRQQYGPVTDFLNVGSQCFPVPSTCQDTSQYLQSRSELKQTLDKTRGSVSDFPFLHPDSGVNIQQFWPKNSNSLPQLSHRRQRNQSSQCLQSYSDIACEGHPQRFGIHMPSVGPEIHNGTGVFNPHNSMTSHMPMTISPFPESVPRHPFVPTLPSTKPTSATKDMKLKSSMTDPIQCSETKKRGADRGYLSMRPSKMPNISAQECPWDLEDLRNGNPGGTEIPVDLCVHDFTLYRGQTRYPECNLSVTPNDMVENPSVINNSKPSQNVDQDKFSSIHSTGPLSAVTYSGSGMELQKSTRTFRL